MLKLQIVISDGVGRSVEVYVYFISGDIEWIWSLGWCLCLFVFLTRTSGFVEKGAFLSRPIG